MRIEEGFQQTPYPDEHPYTNDPVLPSLLKRLVPSKFRQIIETDLIKFGENIVSNIRPTLPPVTSPVLVQYDQLGRRVDKLHTSETWKKLEELSVQEGLVSIAYEREKYGPSSRVYMFAKCMMSVGDFNVVGCPFAMSDGSARVMELYGSEAMKKLVLPRLISRDPGYAYLGGQWMTERPGGSDVSQTETVAHPVESGSEDLGSAYLLDGFKWFSSAAEGHLSVALARTGSPHSGSRGLSLFLVPLRMEGYTSSPLDNGIYLHRLKNKFGTIGLPTAELSLHNTRAWLIGKENEGVRLISPVLNITRIHSSINSLGSLQRALSIARSYATVRYVNSGKSLLLEMPMHMQTLADVTLIYRALTHFVFGAIELLGRSECGVASGNEIQRLRLLTPAVKAFTASLVPEALMECMAALGGLGYMEETGIGRLIRDASVEKIWEGTFNILALDIQRAAKNPKVIQSFVSWATPILSTGRAQASLAEATTGLSSVVDRLSTLIRQSSTNPLLPGIFLKLFSSISCGLYLLQHAIWSIQHKEESADIDVETVNRWVLERDLEILLRQFKHLAAGSSTDRDRKVDMDLKMVYGVGTPKL